MAYKNKIESFPPGIVEMLTQRQVEQGNEKNPEIFQEIASISRSVGGFDWKDTKEGMDFWDEVLARRNFEVFYARYPKDTIPTSPYPKIMLVSNDGESWYQRVVLMEKNKSYLAWCDCETFEQSEKVISIRAWSHAKDLPPPKIKLTKAALIEKLGIDNSALDIFEDTE